jgi:hypothetical protein
MTAQDRRSRDAQAHPLSRTACQKRLNSDRFGHQKPLHHGFTVSTGVTAYSLGDADTTRPRRGVKSKKNLFEKSAKGRGKMRVSRGRRLRFFFVSARSIS